MTKTLLASFAFLVCFFSSGQKYSFVTYSTEQGLPQSQVTAITQDNKGYLWVGTLGGLARFNGRKFVTYAKGDGLLNNRITSLEYFDNTIWVGHDGGISYFKNDEIEHVKFSGDGNDRSRNVSKIIAFKDKILVCSRGGLFELVGNKLEKIALQNEENETIPSAYVHQGQLYLATQGGVLISDDAVNFKLVEEFGEYRFSGISGKNDVLVFATYNDGIYVKDFRTNETQFFSSDDLNYSIDKCYQDEHGSIWLSTFEGVVKINEQREIEFYDSRNGLPLEMVSCIFSDYANNVWIGSLGKGIFRFPSGTFSYYDRTTGFPSDLYLSGFQDQHNNYYLGTFDEGLVKYKKDGSIERIPLNESTIWAAASNVDGKHWFGTGHSLVALDPKSDRIEVHTSKSNENIPGFKVTGLYKISETSMYIGGNHGVALYEDGTFKKLGASSTEIGSVRDFVVRNNELYCVSNLGVFKFQNNEFKIVPNTEMVCYAIELDDNNIIWFGTEDGLYKIDDGVVTAVELSSDPASNFIALLNYRENELYAGTINGLFVLSDLTKDKPSRVRYGISDGIIDLETNLNSGFFDRKGSFWFGTASGLVCYKRERNGGNNSNPRPKVYMTSVLLNYESFDYARYSDSVSIEGLPLNLDLSASKNNLTFEFDGVSLMHKQGLAYQFMLGGLRDEWSTPTETPIITYTSLPAGNYSLHVRAVDVEGIISEEIVFPFVINEAYYKTWWFILLCGLGVATFFILVFRFRIKRLGEINERERLEYKSRLLSLEQKSMNASMNRHFIFNSLNSIQYFINTQDRLSANKYLTNFAKLIRKNLDSATSEGNLVTLGEELERLELYLSLESMRFKDKFDYVIDTGGIDLESVPIPPMMMQPFIENSIIHGILPDESKKGLITIKVEKGETHLNIIIEDNGIGINNSLSKKSPSIGDHRSQGMEITSKRIELIQKITNNGISLEGPEEIIDENRLINGTRVLIKIPLEDLEIE